MTGLIELKLGNLNQLFNSMDPSPFHERDLDANAEEFIVSWAMEHPRQDELRLVIHLTGKPAAESSSKILVTDSVHHYFTYRADLSLREFKRLMREGRAALFVGLSFLALCQITASIIPVDPPGYWKTMVHEGLAIIGWVAMWRPLEIYLYRWWPILSLRKLYLRLARMEVEIRTAPPIHPTDRTSSAPAPLI
jgi:hypothetical protein